MADENQVIEFAPKPSQGQPWDVAIIGSGPASFTAAIYTTRGAASTLVLAGEAWGGQLMLTTEVDNFPGFPGGIMGPDLMMNMRKQAQRFGAEIVDKKVAKVDVSEGDKPFSLSVGDTHYLAKSIIIATGADTRWLGVPGEEKLRGRGVSSCAPCDAPFFKDKSVIVVGGGDSAMEEALVLTKYATKVTLVHRRDAFKASAAMQDKVFALEKEGKIEILWNKEILEMIGEGKLEKVKLKDTATNEESEKQIDGVFVAIGHTPATEIYKGVVDLDEKGYVVKNAQDGFNSTTSVKGIFVAGDVHDYHYRQAITAAAFGCMAGMDVLKYLDKSAPSW